MLAVDKTNGPIETDDTHLGGYHMNVGAHNAGPTDAVASCTAANSSAGCSLVLTLTTWSRRRGGIVVLVEEYTHSVLFH